MAILKKKILRQLVQLSQIKKVKKKERKRTKNLNQNAESDQHISD